MSAAFSFMIHNEDLYSLKNLYITAKGMVLEQNRFMENSHLENRTLMAMRSLIISKLTNELYNDYIEIYEGVNPKSRTTDFTGMDEFLYIQHYQKELDLEDFFETHNYYHKENLLDEEIEAENNFGKEIFKKVLSEDIKKLEFQLKLEQMYKVRINKQK